MTIPFTLDRIGNQYRCVITDANGNSVASDYGELRQADNNWTFTYDANGMRTSRSNGVRTYSYVYNGGKLSKMSVPYHTMEFTYDADGKPFSLIYNGDTYYYVTNLQGDVVAIVGSGGTVVVRYTYDAWGRVLTISGGLAMSIGHLNPLRYRGYIYDPETRLYYLQSRYYDPEMGRFISSDVYTSTGQGLLGNNMFAYCANAPVIRIDIAGTMSFECDDENSDLSNNNVNEWSGGGWEEFRQTLKHAARGLNMAMGNRNPLYTEYHHVFSNKNKTYTPKYKKILDRYNMSLDSRENIIELHGHHGRHTNAYHNLMLDALAEVDSIAAGNVEMFYEGIMIIVEFIRVHSAPENGR